jgi:hypothetical protein
MRKGNKGPSGAPVNIAAAAPHKAVGRLAIATLRVDRSGRTHVQLFGQLGKI